MVLLARLLLLTRRLAHIWGLNSSKKFKVICLSVLFLQLMYPFLFSFILQETLKEYSNLFSQSPEVTSKVSVPNGEVNDGIKILTEKLSAALVNVGAKEDLVKQHAKVAEEAIAGQFGIYDTNSQYTCSFARS